MREFEPKLIAVFREGYSRAQFLRDLSAGLIVGVVALPLALAFAIASGLKPEQGLYTAVVAGTLIALLSGSRVQIGGPTGAFIVIVYAIVQRHGYDGLALATMMAGGLLVLMGAARLGTLIQYIPYPVTVGFTAGIALVIAAGQIGDFLGLQLASAPAGFLQKLAVYGRHLAAFNPSALALGVVTVAIMVWLPVLAPRLPGSLVALVVTTAAVPLLDLPVETIATRFGGVPQGLPLPKLPAMDWSKVPDLISPAISIALLAAIESLLAAVVADGMTGRRHRSNMELIAQGVANVASPLFGGMPATGAIARTATNIKSGGRTPVAGLVHAATLLLILVAAGRWAALVPMATLAGILLVVAWNMSERHLFARVLRSTRSDALVLLATFALTVFADLTIAIQVGVVLAALLFMRRMAEVTQVRAITSLLDEEEQEEPELAQLGPIPKDVEVYEINGPFFFGAAHKFRTTLSSIQRRPRVLVLRMDAVLAMDATGLQALEDLLSEARRDGTALLLAGVQPQPREVLERVGFLDRTGRDRVFETLAGALDRARQA